MAFSLDPSTNVPASRDGAGGRRDRWFPPLFFGWATVYLVLQGQNGFFASTVDRIDSAWLRWTVLNFPLHLVLGLAALAALRASPPRAQRTGRLLAVLVTGLIAGHATLSILTS